MAEHQDETRHDERRQDESRRADAQQNRQRILTVALATLTAVPDASLNSIAKAAGVGPGTLYRHFPSREALILAVYRHEIDQLVALGGTLLGENPPLAALRLWFDRLAHFGRIKHGVADVLHAAMNEGVAGETYAAMVAALDRLLRACAAAGEIREGVDPEDMLLLVGFLWRVPPGPAGVARAERLLDLVMDGLRRQG